MNVPQEGLNSSVQYSFFENSVFFLFFFVVTGVVWCFSTQMESEVACTLEVKFVLSTVSNERKSSHSIN